LSSVGWDLLVNPYNKLEASIHTCYKDMKDDVKVENGLVWGS